MGSISIDKIICKTNTFQMDTHAPLLISPVSYRTDGKQQNKLYLGRNRNGDLIEGEYAKLCDPELNRKGVHVHFRRQYMTLAFSPQRYATGGIINFAHLDESDLQRIFQEVIDRLFTLGVSVDINDLDVHHLEIASDNKMEFSPVDYFSVIEACKPKSWKVERIKTSLYAGNNQKRFLLYDKKKKCIDDEEEETIPQEFSNGNWLRNELQIMNKRTFQNLTGIRTVGDILRNYNIIYKVYDSMLSKLVPSPTSYRGKRGLRITKHVSKNKEMLKRLRALPSSMKYGNECFFYSAFLGMEAIEQTFGSMDNYFKSFLGKNGLTKSTINDIIRKIDKARRAIQDFDNSEISMLEEIRMKFLTGGS